MRRVLRAGVAIALVARMRTSIALSLLVAVSTSLSAATAQAAPPASASAPPPYSLPWQLRPALPVSALRLESVIAAFDAGGGRTGVTDVTTLLFSWKLKPWVAPIMRLGLVANSLPGAPTAVALTNLVVGSTFGLPLPKGFRVGFLFALALPTGDGWGLGNPPATAAVRAGVLARSAMDNAMFATNDLVIIPGVDLAWVGRGLTVQIEATVLQLMRVRGAEAQKDAQRTNLTMGIHVGYFLVKQLSIGVDIRYQRFLSTPAAVAADKTGTLVDNVTIAGGVRGHFKIGDGMWVRPGIAYVSGLDDPMLAQGYRIVHLDLPFTF